jgi:prepilin-type N-terminal cleavage/methylation domain-containing protein
MNSTPVQPAVCRRAQSRALTLIELLVVLAIIGVLASIIFPTVSTHPVNHRRSVDSTNLRSIGGAMLAAENDHPGTLYSINLPDIHAFAAQLARFGLNDPKLWLSKIDATNPYTAHPPTTILVADPSADGSRPINPKFQGVSLAFAAAGFPPGTDITKLPVTTPLAWTRGLQPNGIWSKDHAPYGDWGGFIVFVGGNLEKFKNIDGKLVKFGTTQPTSDIREALPPGTRILESQPKPQP